MVTEPPEATLAIEVLQTMSLPPSSAPTVTGLERQLPGRDSHPLGLGAFSRRTDQRQLFCRRIPSPDLLPGEHRCLRILATEGRHDVDDQSGKPPPPLEVAGTRHSG